MGWQDGWSAGNWLVTSLLMLTFWTLVVAGAVWLIWRRPPDPAARHSADARQILDERLARGEIDPDEYRERRDLLVRR